MLSNNSSKSLQFLFERESKNLFILIEKKNEEIENGSLLLLLLLISIDLFEIESCKFRRRLKFTRGVMYNNWIILVIENYKIWNEKWIRKIVISIFLS